MRDPMQLELNFNDAPVELTTQEQDAATEHRGKQMAVRVFLNTVARGHKTWADRNAPKTSELVEYGQWLLDNPDDLGNQYADILRQEIDLRIKEMMNKMPVMKSKTTSMDVYQDCY